LEQEIEQKHHEKNRIDQLANLITALSASQRQLTQVALDYQCLALAKKHQIKEQIELADETGDILEILIHLLKKATEELAEYCPDPDA
jgi:hypothetical protein